jgi:hypothetical protein
MERTDPNVLNFIFFFFSKPKYARGVFRPNDIASWISYTLLKINVEMEQTGQNKGAMTDQSSWLSAGCNDFENLCSVFTYDFQVHMK